jgi:hypothetical protein
MAYFMQEKKLNLDSSLLESKVSFTIVLSKKGRLLDTFFTGSSMPCVRILSKAFVRLPGNVVAVNTRLGQF